MVHKDKETERLGYANFPNRGGLTCFNKMNLQNRFLLGLEHWPLKLIGNTQLPNPLNRRRLFVLAFIHLIDIDHE